MYRNSNNDIYKMYEEEVVINDKLKKENHKLKLENYVLTTNLENIKKQLEKSVDDTTKIFENKTVNLQNKLTNAYEEINRLKEQINNYNNDDKDYVIDKLTSELNKDSTNSSIPTSKESIKNSEKRRTNTYNHRETSNNKSGGQFNHEGVTLTKQKLEEKIKENKLPVKTIKHYVNNKKYNKEIVKYKVGIKVKTYIEKHIFIPSDKTKKILPKSFYSDVTYANDLKSIVLILGNYCSLSYNKISELLSDFTNDIVHVSEGTIDNIYEEFSNKSENTILNIINNLLNGTFQHTDETVTKENGKDSYYRGYGNKENVLYKYHNHKGDIPIEEDGILNNFIGTLITDHDKGMFKYGTNNQDCIIHFGRYCKEQEQNIINTTWQMSLYNLLLKFERNRKILIKYKMHEFKEEEINYMNKEYDAILELAKVENEYIQSTYWEEKANSLLNRCIKYKNQMLLFIHDFTIDYDNNFMERALRMIKNKTKISGGFRSYNGGVRFGNIMSIIKTSKLRKINPFTSIVSIMDGNAIFGTN